MEGDVNLADEQKPPGLEELAGNYFWNFLRRKFGPTRAFVIFVIVSAVVYFHREIAEGFSDLNAKIVEWSPLPKAPPDIFTVAIARLEDDNAQTHVGPTLVQDLQELGGANGVAVLEFRRTLAADSPTDVQAGKIKAREWLKRSGAQALIWGKVLTANGKSVPELYWTVDANANPKKPSDRYVLGEDLRLPPVFQADLADILHLLVTTQSSAFNAEEGNFVADRLLPFIDRVRHLLESEAAKTWPAEDVARTNLILGNALTTVGEQKGDDAALSQAINCYNETLKTFSRQRDPLDWAETQNNLGSALNDLSQWESGTQHLTEAVAAYLAALEERTRERVPLDWAMIQNGLGSALCTLGERESDTLLLMEAVVAFRDALEELTRARAPLLWAGTQNNLGVALWTLGARESITWHLTEAVAAFRATLKEYTRERVPRDWAMTQDNLGNALSTLGERELDTQHLTEAVAAYRAALEERTRERVPLQWAVTQNHLGLALRTLGARTSDPAMLCEALDDQISAWQVFSEAAPYFASKAVAAAKLDVEAIRRLQTDAACLQTHASDLKHMGVTN